MNDITICYDFNVYLLFQISTKKLFEIFFKILSSTCQKAMCAYIALTMIFPVTIIVSPKTMENTFWRMARRNEAKLMSLAEKSTFTSWIGR